MHTDKCLTFLQTDRQTATDHQKLDHVCIRMCLVHINTCSQDGQSSAATFTASCFPPKWWKNIYKLWHVIYKLWCSNTATPHQRKRYSRQAQNRRERGTETERQRVCERKWETDTDFFFFFFTPEKWTVPLVNKGALIKKWDIPLAQMWPKNKFLVNEIQHPAFADDI